MSTKSEKLTASKKKDIIFSDFAMNLNVHPGTGQLIRITNEKAINSRLKTLLLTNAGERLYQPLLGGNIRATLFEPMDNFTANDLKDNIRTTIFNSEPAIERVNVSVNPDFDQNSYDVLIEYMVNNEDAIYKLELTLVRTR